MEQCSVYFDFEVYRGEGVVSSAGSSLRKTYCLFPISVNFENHQYLRCFMDFRDDLIVVRNR